MPIEPPDALTILVRRSQAGVGGALAELRAELPGLIPWAELERLDREAREAWAAAAGGGRADRVAAKLRALGRTADRLARPGAGRLERLLAGRLALAADVLRHATLDAARTPEGTPADVRSGLLRRVRRAEREHAAAGRTLDAVQQRLAVGAGETNPPGAGSGPHPARREGDTKRHRPAGGEDQ